MAALSILTISLSGVAVGWAGRAIPGPAHKNRTAVPITAEIFLIEESI
jgi:hypothetical protein